MSESKNDTNSYDDDEYSEDKLVLTIGNFII